MERFPVELLYVLGFIAIVLFNFIAQRAARRRQQAEEAHAAPPPAQPAAPPPEEPLEDIWGRTPAAARASAAASAPAPVARVAPLPAPAEPSRRRFPVRALLDDRRGLRRAIILMTVLGPCRAQEPPPRR
jgi:hypothetical protein